MSHSAFLALVLFAAPDAGATLHANSARLREFEATTFEKVERLDALPAEVRKGLATATRQGAIAEAGEEWNPTCQPDGKLPGYRFIFAGKSAGLWFVLYEGGGYAHHREVVTMRATRTGTFSVEGEWPVMGAVTTISELKAAVRGG